MLNLLRLARRLARWLGLSRAVSDQERKTMYQPRTVPRLFIKPYCGWCAQAMDWLDDHGIRYEVLDVIADQAAYEEMTQLSGQTLAPVIQVDGRLLADFGARELEAFWRELTARPPVS